MKKLKVILVLTAAAAVMTVIISAGKINDQPSSKGVAVESSTSMKTQSNPNQF